MTDPLILQKIEEIKARIEKSNSPNVFPHITEMLPHQIEVLLDKTRFKVLVWHRRSRKTTTAIEKLVAEALNPVLKNQVFWHIFPTYNEAKVAVWQDPNMLFRILPRELIEKTNETELTVYLKNGSIISLKGADSPERLLGANPFGVVLDEFAEMKPETWSRIIQPILRANGGFCWFIGTPRGRNHLYQMYLKGQRNQEEWKSWLLKASESKVIPQEQLELAKLDMSPALFGQEMECEFLEGEGSVFRNVRRCATAQPQPPIVDHLYVIGIDLARLVDYTVLAVYDRATNSQVFQDKFQTIDWAFQKERIIQTAKLYNNALCVIDGSGIGDPVCDDLLRSGVAVEPIKFTENSKKELIEKMSIWLDQEKIHFINMQETVDEFENFSYELGNTGRIRYQAPPGFHDDIVISNCLAAWGLFPLQKKEMGLKPPSAIRLMKERLANKTDDDNYNRSMNEWAEGY